LKICHVTQYCHTQSWGGTERYILEVIRSMQKHANTDSCIAWLAPVVTRNAAVDDSDIPILRLPAGLMRADPPPADLIPVSRELLFKKYQPDLLHFHTFGRSEAALADEANKQGIPYVFTYHSPAWSCRRETMLRWGREICDGKIRAFRCSACKVQERLDIHPAIAWIVVMCSFPFGVLGLLSNGTFRRRSAFVLETWQLSRAFRRFLQGAVFLLSCCEWSMPVLQRNGASRQKTLLCPQGVPMAYVQSTLGRKGKKDSRLTIGDGIITIGYIGRCTPVKGIHIIVEAFAKTVSPNLRLFIYGWESHVHIEDYTKNIKHYADNDQRISLIEKLPFEKMIDEYMKLDLLVIPSVWLETGPLTLFEALQMGVPVWGASTIGQIDLLKQYGRVIEPNTVSSWRQAFQKLAEDTNGAMLNRREGNNEQTPLRSMHDVSCELYDIYRRAVCLSGNIGKLNEEIKIDSVPHFN
jgi:glycosyltransferase involved in cell wall biosynthesis